MNKICGMEEAQMIIITRSMLQPGCVCFVCVHHSCLPQLMKEDFLLIILIQFWASQERISHLFQGDVLCMYGVCVCVWRARVCGVLNLSKWYIVP